MFLLWKNYVTDLHLINFWKATAENLHLSKDTDLIPSDNIISLVFFHLVYQGKSTTECIGVSTLSKTLPSLSCQALS